MPKYVCVHNFLYIFKIVAEIEVAWFSHIFVNYVAEDILNVLSRKLHFSCSIHSKAVQILEAPTGEPVCPKMHQLVRDIAY